MLKDNTFVKEVKECPVCGSSERYFEGLLRRLQEQGLVDKGITCFNFQLTEGIPVPQDKMAKMVIGDMVPTFKHIWDTCRDCGIMYTTHLQEGMVKKSIETAKTLPNRAHRRHPSGELDLSKLAFNNPNLS